MIGVYRNKSISKNNAGLTLIELMIVVVIIGILAGLAYTKYSRVVREAKLREAAIMLAYLYDIQYLYYVEHGTFVNEIYWWPIVFDLETGYGWFDEKNRELQRKVSYEPPGGTSHFYYVSYYAAGGGCVTYAYPKLSTSSWDFPEDQIDDSMAGITLVVDNDRRIYVYGDGHFKEL